MYIYIYIHTRCGCLWAKTRGTTSTSSASAERPVGGKSGIGFPWPSLREDAMEAMIGSTTVETTPQEAAAAAAQGGRAKAGGAGGGIAQDPSVAASVTSMDELIVVARPRQEPCMQCMLTARCDTGACMYIYIYIYICIYIYVYIYIYTCMHACSCLRGHTCVFPPPSCKGSA